MLMLLMLKHARKRSHEAGTCSVCQREGTELIMDRKEAFELVIREDERSRK
jgi:hypothetical protein